MPRAIWSGAISFGLVSIPVKLYTAKSPKSVRFNQLDGRDNQRIKQKRVNAHTGEEVPYDEIVKGYEIMKDTYVVITDDELESLSPKASRSIDIVEFVEEDEIDPVFYQSSYYLVPDELALKSYALLTEAMANDGRVALARLVMRTKEYLAAIRPSDGRLMLNTMMYSDEVVDASEIPGLETLDEVEVSDAERTMAKTLIESLAGGFNPDKYEDTFRNEVLDLIERKSKGELTTVAEDAPAASDTVIDLMAALEASVAAAKKARAGHPTGDASKKASAKKKPAKKAAKKATKKKAPAKKAAKSA
ncbi:MAG: Ku protein [Acidimicrobiales bacterium]